MRLSVTADAWYLPKQGRRYRGFPCRCDYCGEAFICQKGNPGKFCSRSCHQKSRTGVQSPWFGKRGPQTANWKGPRLSSMDRIMVRKPGHPRADKAGYVLRAVLVAWHVFGPFPRNWHVHHLDGNKHNDRAGNLIILPNGVHSAYHRALEKNCLILRGKAA